MTTTEQHKFEKAGLGKAPFRLIRVEERRGPWRELDKNGQPTGFEIGAPGQPMGCCKYCYTGIAVCYVIESTDGNRFDVGCECVKKVGDAGLIKVINKEKAKAAKAREAQRIGDMRDRLTMDDELRKLLDSKPHPQKWRRERGETLLDSIEWMMDNAGHAGRIKTVRKIEKLEKGVE